MFVHEDVLQGGGQPHEAEKLLGEHAVFADMEPGFVGEFVVDGVGSGKVAEAAFGLNLRLGVKEAVESRVDDAVAKGGKLLTGGVRPKGPGYFSPVTVLAEGPDDARIMREEPFGPLAVINPTASLDQAIAMANALPFGLAHWGLSFPLAALAGAADRRLW
mgnify:CR=1 FL=1